MVLEYFYKIKLQNLGYKTGFTIAQNVFSYGLVVPHIGTIVVGSGNTIGKYAVMHTSTCITAGEKQIGDGLYCSTGAKIIGNISLGDNITIATNAVVNKNIPESNCLLVGIPAEVKKGESCWYFGEKYNERVMKCEKKLRCLADDVSNV